MSKMAKRCVLAVMSLTLASTAWAVPPLKITLKSAAGTPITSGSIQVVAGNSQVSSDSVSNGSATLKFPAKITATGAPLLQLLSFMSSCQATVTTQGNQGQAALFTLLEVQVNPSGPTTFEKVALSAPGEVPATMYLMYAESEMKMSGTLTCPPNSAPASRIELNLAFKPGWNLLHVYALAKNGGIVTESNVDHDAFGLETLTWTGNTVLDGVVP